MADITLIWSIPTPAPTSYTVQYRRKGDTEWVFLNNILEPPVVIRNVPEGQSWEGFVVSKCGFKDVSAPKAWEINAVPQTTNLNWSYTEFGGAAGSLDITINGTQQVHALGTTGGTIPVKVGDNVLIQFAGGSGTYKTLVVSNNQGAMYNDAKITNHTYSFVVQVGMSYNVEAIADPEQQ